MDWDEVTSIYKLIWTGRFEEAGSQLAPLRRKHAVYDQLGCEVAVAIALLCEKKERYNEALERIGETRKSCSELWKAKKPHLKRYMDELHLEKSSTAPVPPDNQPLNIKYVENALWGRAITAEIVFQECMIKFRQEKYLKGVIDFKKSWNLYRECSQYLDKLCASDKAKAEIPRLLEIRCIVDFGVGMFHFICSVVPRHFQFIVEGIGFKADRILAMEELKRSMGCETGFRSHFAALALAWIYAFFYFDYKIAIEILELELQTFQGSALILYTYGYILRKSGQLEASSEQFRKARENCVEFPEFVLKVDYELGSNHFLVLEWAKALEYLSVFLEKNETEAFRAYCAYQVAFCHIMLGDNDAAAANMKKIAPWVRKNYALDEYAGRQARKFLAKKQLDEFELLYQQAMLLQEACKYSETLAMLDQAKTKEKSIVDTGRATQLRASTLFHLKRYDEAKALYKEVCKSEKDLSKSGTASYSLPWSYCGLSEIAIVEKDSAGAESAIKKAKSFSNYEFESFLVWRIRKCEEDIRLMRTTK